MRGHGYIAALDGLRGLAVVAVLSFHGGRRLGARRLPRRRLVLRAQRLPHHVAAAGAARTGRIALARFWARRARRLLPALSSARRRRAVRQRRGPRERGRSAGTRLATLGYVANWRFISGAATSSDAAPSLLEHTWSLAIEEQFYLVWPLIVVGVLTCANGLRSAALAAIVALGGHRSRRVLMALLYEPGTDPSRVYYGTDTRARRRCWSAPLLAMWFTSASRRRGTASARRPCTVRHSLLAVVLGWRLVVDQRASVLAVPGRLPACCAVLVVVVIASVSQPQSGPLGAVLSLRPIRWIGRISYGLYLWHWPVYVFLSPTRTDLDGDELFALRLAMTFAIATVSYYAVERPIRTGAWRGWRIRVAAPTAAAVVAAALLIVTLEAPGQQVVSANPRPPAPRSASTSSSTRSRRSV